MRSFEVEVRRGKSHDGGGPKPRTIPVVLKRFEPMVDVLRYYITHVRPRLARAGERAFFVGERGRLSAGAVSAIFRKYRNLAGLSKDLTAHCLRHTFATSCFEDGMSLRTLSTLLGHAHETTTWIYIRTADENFVLDELARLQASMQR